MGIFRKLSKPEETHHQGETAEFNALLEQGLEDLRLQAEAHHAAWRLGDAERWDFSQETGELVFTFPHLIVRAPAQVIGTYGRREETWLWAWANESVAEDLARDAVRVREYGTEHEISRLTTPSWPCTEADAWKMAALANRLCRSNGVYRAPADSTLLFFTFGPVRMEKMAQ